MLLGKTCTLLWLNLGVFLNLVSVSDCSLSTVRNAIYDKIPTNNYWTVTILVNCIMETEFYNKSIAFVLYIVSVKRVLAKVSH